MWLKNLFTSRQSSSDKPQKALDSAQFQLEQTCEDSCALIDLTPDMRYYALQQAQKTPTPGTTIISKIPFPQHLIGKSQTIVYSKVQPQNGFECRSAHGNWTQVKLLLTDRQLLMSPNIFSSLKSINTHFIDIPLGEIERLQVKQSKKQPLKLHIILKDNRQLIFTHKINDHIKTLNEKLSKFTHVNGINKFYAFRYRHNWHNKMQQLQQGWDVYNMRAQFTRQGVYKLCSVNQSQKEFKYAYKIVKNHSYELSDTYPAEFIVPFNLSREEIVKMSKFRTRARLPALTYFYEYKPQCFSTLFRCSQIKTGVMGNRCEQDEKVVKQIADSSNFISKVKKIYQRYNIKIYDARGYYAALGNLLAGKGYQRQDTYNCEVQFLNIPNIHAVRDSYNLVKSSSHQVNGIYETVISSCWLQYVGLILTGAKEMAMDLMAGKNVLVHCSDGWDRTAQLSSVCQLLIDPYYRTIEGIAVLIEKDWRSFGHKFRQRTAQFHPTTYHPYEKSPVFIQFLDCIYQLICQFPLSFQYDSSLLQFLSKHVNSCIYGTFMANNMKEAAQCKIETQTVSIWTDVLFADNCDEFINPFYQETLNQGFLNVNLDMKYLNVWREHLFYEQGTAQVASFALKKEKLISKSLKEQVNANEKIIAQLKAQLQKNNQNKT